MADDEPLSRWAIGQAVAERGGLVSEASSREEVCTRIVGGDLDVVVMACRLGGLDMTDVLSELARHMPSIRLIVLCEDESEPATQGQIPGALVLEKPFSLETLLGAVQATGTWKPAR